MKLLALDTATLDASVALIDGDSVRAEATCAVTTHSEGLLTLIDQVLRESSCALADVRALVCGAGPGSFTGLRIGLATAKGLCFAAGKPLLCCCSLDALGLAGALEVGPSRTALALLDARRGQVYGRRYRAGTAQEEPFVGTVEDAVARLDPAEQALALGDGAQRYAAELQALHAKLSIAAAERHRMSAALLARSARQAAEDSAFSPLDQAVPIYLRPPDVRPPPTPFSTGPAGDRR